jgi:hypothetical protein
MHAKTYFKFFLFSVCKYDMIFFFYLWETGPYAWKQDIFFCFIIFCNVSMKTGYFNIRLVSLQYKNTNQYYAKLIKKIYRKIIKFFKRIFFWKFLEWAEPCPTILVWASAAWPSEQWRTLQCSHATWTVEDEAGEEEKEEEEKRTCSKVLSFTVAVLWR